MSAPVKGRLLDSPPGLVLDPAVLFPEPPDPVLGRALVGAGEVELPAIVGVVEHPVIDPQLAAPAAPGTINSELRASPDPINRRFAHMMIALLPVEAVPLGSPRGPRCRSVTIWLNYPCSSILHAR
jgi:hypothetical protein